MKEHGTKNAAKPISTNGCFTQHCQLFAAVSTHLFLFGLLCGDGSCELLLVFLVVFVVNFDGPAAVHAPTTLSVAVFASWTPPPPPPTTTAQATQTLVVNNC